MTLSTLILTGATIVVGAVVTIWTKELIPFCAGCITAMVFVFLMTRIVYEKEK